MDSTNHELVLAQWLEEDAAVRARQQGVGLARPEEIAELSGLQILQAMIAGKLPPPPITDTLDFMLVQASKGQATFQGTPKLRHYNPLGGVHGGWFATLLDSALGCAVMSALPAGQSYTTLELKINLVRGLSTQVPAVRAVARTVHVGKQVATAEAQLIGHDGKLYAHSSTTCLVFPRR
ncbi:MAG: PaaI family thioesterase [Paucibacter sp.]|nr:PaaI family thioesterase [Roseateles sp.]